MADDNHPINEVQREVIEGARKRILACAYAGRGVHADEVDLVLVTIAQELDRRVEAERKKPRGKQMKAAILLLLVSSLTACAGPAKYSWDKAGPSPIEVSLQRETRERKRVAILVVTEVRAAQNISEDSIYSTETRLQSGQEGDLLRRFPDKLRLIDRNSVNRLLAEARLDQVGLISAETRAALGKLTGATHLLYIDATIRSSNGQWPVILYGTDFGCRLLDIERGEVLASQTVYWDSNHDARDLPKVSCLGN